MPKPVGNLHAADAGHIVLIGIQVAALGYAAEPAALSPGEVRVVRPVVPVEGVGRVGIGNRAGYAVHGDPGELVGPGRVCVGIADAVLPAGDAAKVARGVDGIIDRRSGCGRRGGSGIGVPGLLRKLVQIVIGIDCQRPGSVGAVDGVDLADLREISVGVLGVAIRSNTGALSFDRFSFPRGPEPSRVLDYCRESGDFAGNQGEISVSGASHGTAPACSRVHGCVFSSSNIGLFDI